MVAGTEKIAGLLRTRTRLTLDIREDGEHNEANWKAVFPKFLEVVSSTRRVPPVG